MARNSEPQNKFSWTILRTFVMIAFLPAPSIRFREGGCRASPDLLSSAGLRCCPGKWCRALGRAGTQGRRLLTGQGALGGGVTPGQGRQV